MDEYEEFVYKGTKKMFEENKMILVCQQLSMSGIERRRIKNLLLDNEMKLEIYSNKLMRFVPIQIKIKSSEIFKIFHINIIYLVCEIYWPYRRSTLIDIDNDQVKEISYELE